MARISLARQVAELRREFRELPEREFKRGAASALNKIANQARNQAARQIAAEYSLPVSAIKKSLSVKRRANRNELTATIAAAGAPLPLILFKARQTRKGVTVQVKRGSRRLIAGAFIKTLSSGHRGVFARGRYASNEFAFRHKRIRRFPDNDLSITELVGVGVPTGFRKDAVQDALRQLVESKFGELLHAELTFRTMRVGR